MVECDSSFFCTCDFEAGVLSCVASLTRGCVLMMRINLKPCSFGLYNVHDRCEGLAGQVHLLDIYRFEVYIHHQLTSIDRSTSNNEKRQRAA